MSNNEELYEQAIEAITELYNDMSVGKLQTRDNLNYLIGEIEVMREALGV